MTFNKRVEKAVFPVAGLGTRFLPATKAMPKELLPIVDKPLIQYAAEEAISAGINTLIFVTGRNKRAIEDHFDSNFELEIALEQKGRYDEASMIRNIVPNHVECIFVRQPKQLGLGHAILRSERAVAGEPFSVLLADDFLTDNKFGVTSDLVRAFSKTGRSQLSVMEVSENEISKYGIVSPLSGQSKIAGIIEKPKPENAPSNLASIGRYILTPDIFDILRQLPIGSGGEIQLADAINIQAQNGGVDSVPFKGKRFDCGSVEGFIAGINHEFQARSKT